MYVPEMSKLNGLSLVVAECYGKPHYKAFYTGKTIKQYRMEDGAICMCCGHKATNVHHVPALSKGHVFNLRTDCGIFALRPALFALCGSGTTGCHNDFHGGARFIPQWKWFDDEYARAWWSGEILREIDAHSPELYEYGRWVITDSIRNKSFEVSYV